jgi:uroporphyrinogen-III synthase
MMGFEPLCASPLKVEIGTSPAIASFFDRLIKGEIDVVVLTSSTGVESLVKLLELKGERDRATASLNGTTLVAIGPITANAMLKVGLVPSFVPKVYSSEGLVDELSGTSLKGARVALLRSNHGEAILEAGLKALGAVVDDIAIYCLVPERSNPELDHMIREALAGRVDAFAFTSSLSAETFIAAAELLSPRRIRDILRCRTVAAMGEPTRRKLEAMGIKVDIVPSRSTFEDMLRAIPRTGPLPSSN